MSQQQFDEYMQAQAQAIVDSGDEPELWIEQHAEEFRAQWEKDHE